MSSNIFQRTTALSIVILMGFQGAAFAALPGPPNEDEKRESVSDAATEKQTNSTPPAKEMPTIQLPPLPAIKMPSGASQTRPVKDETPTSSVPLSTAEPPPRPSVTIGELKQVTEDAPPKPSPITLTPEQQRLRQLIEKEIAEQQRATTNSENAKSESATPAPTSTKPAAAPRPTSAPVARNPTSPSTKAAPTEEAAPLRATPAEQTVRPVRPVQPKPASKPSPAIVSPNSPSTQTQRTTNSNPPVAEARQEPASKPPEKPALNLPASPSPTANPAATTASTIDPYERWDKLADDLFKQGQRQAGDWKTLGNLIWIGQYRYPAQRHVVRELWQRTLRGGATWTGNRPPPGTSQSSILSDLRLVEGNGERFIRMELIWQIQSPQKTVVLASQTANLSPSEWPDWGIRVYSGQIFTD